MARDTGNCCASDQSMGARERRETEATRRMERGEGEIKGWRRKKREMWVGRKKHEERTKRQERKKMQKEKEREETDSQSPL